MSNEFIINDIKLNVSPVDISVTHRKNIGTHEFLRDNASHAFKTRYAYTSYNVVLQFDTDNGDDLRNLVMLCTELDLYPFVFIKSDRLSSLIPHTSASSNGYHMWGIQQYEIIQGFDSTNIITVVIELLFFNYVPFTSGFTFKHLLLRDNVPQACFINQPTTETQSQVSVIPKGSLVDEEDGSVSLFRLYFEKEIQARLKTITDIKMNVDKTSVSDVFISYPVFSDYKPADYEELRKYNPPLVSELTYTKEGNIKVKEVSKPGNNIEGINQEEFRKATTSTIYLEYKTLKDQDKKLASFNSGNRAVQMMSVSRQNNFAEHYLSGWNTPILQYMGKGKTELNMTVEYNIGLDPSVTLINTDGYPLDFIKVGQMEIQSNMARYRGYDAINNMRINSFILELCPSYSFVLNASSDSDSDQKQGLRTTSYNFYGTDTRKLLSKAIAESVAYSADASGGIKTNASKPRKQPDGTFTNSKDGSPIKDETLAPSGDLGKISGLNESGRNPAAISAEKDYGSYQFSLKKGIPTDYIRQSDKFGSYFTGLTPGSAAFDAQWISLGTGPYKDEFAEDQRLFAVDYYYETQMQKLMSHNIDLRSMPDAVQEMVFSTAIQYGQDTTVITSALKSLQGKDPSTYNPADIINMVQDYKLDNMGKRMEDHLRRHPEQRAALENRIKREKQQLLDLLGNQGGSTTQTADSTRIEGAQDDIDKLEANVIQAHKYAMRSFLNEAIPDLDIGYRLGITDGSGQLGKYGLDDSRRFDPFFFLIFEGYFNSNQFFRAQSLVVDKVLKNEAINPTELSSKIIEAGKTEKEKETEELPLYASSTKRKEEPDGEMLLNVDRILTVADKKREEGSKSKFSKLIPKEVSSAGQFVEKLSNAVSDTILGKTYYSIDVDNVSKRDPLYQEEDIFSLYTAAKIDPFSIQDQSSLQSDVIGKPFEDSLNLCYPTIKVYAVRSNDVNILSTLTDNKNELYELSGISEIDLVTNDDESPVDYLEFTIDNPGSCFTDDSVIFNDFRPIRDHNKAGRESETRFQVDQLRLMVGLRLHIKAGYGNDINELETIFNGVITEISPFNMTETTLRIAAEGFGRELVAVRHGDKYSNNFWWSANTLSIITEVLYNGEIEHFGEYKIGKTDPLEGGSVKVPFFNGFWDWSKSNLYTNLYIEEIHSRYSEDNFRLSPTFGVPALFGGRQSGYDFAIYKATPWDCLKEMEFRHPGLLSKPLLYSDRMTYFVGIREQLYVAKDVPYTYRRLDSTLETQRRNPFATPEDVFNDMMRDKHTVQKRYYDATEAQRFKPVCNFHMFTSDNNIIFNGLKLNGKFNTVVNVEYWNELDNLEDKDFEYNKMKVDDNLKPWDHRAGELSGLGIDGEYMSIRYGSTYLRRQVETMYGGQIILVGNPNIKAGDYASLLDESRNLRGIIKIRECKHSWSKDQGYITVITPGCLVEEYMIDYSQLFETLFISSYLINNIYIKDNARAAHENNYELGLLRMFSDTKDRGGEFKLIGGSNLEDSALARLVVSGIGSAVGGTGTFIINNLRNIEWAATKLRYVGVATTTLREAIIGIGYASQVVTGFGAGLSSGTIAAADIGATVGTRALWIARTTLSLAFEPLIAGGAILSLGAMLVMSAAIVGANVLYNNWNNARQPLRMFPLRLYNQPYIGGISGYEENTVSESWSINWDNAMLQIGEFMEAVR